MMNDFLSRFNGGQLIGFVAVAGGLLCGIVSIIGHFWKVNRLTALKQDMVARGMSVEEIEAVVNAGTGQKPVHRHRSCRG